MKQYEVEINQIEKENTHGMERPDGYVYEMTSTRHMIFHSYEEMLSELHYELGLCFIEITDTKIVTETFTEKDSGEYDDEIIDIDTYYECFIKTFDLTQEKELSEEKYQEQSNLFFTGRIKEVKYLNKKQLNYLFQWCQYKKIRYKMEVSLDDNDNPIQELYTITKLN